MEPVLSQTRQDGGDESSLELIQSGSGILDQMLFGQFETSISTVRFPDIFPHTGRETPPQSSDFNLDYDALGLGLTIPPAATNFDFLPNNSLPLNPNAQFSFPLSPIYKHMCHLGHNHSPWPRKGLVNIQKCERRCHFCGLNLKTAATLRKASNQDHKLRHKGSTLIRIYS